MNDPTFDSGANETCQQKSQRQRKQRVDAQKDDERKVDIGPDHHEFALSEVGNLGRFVDEDESERHERVHAALRQSTDRGLEEHVHQSSFRLSRFLERQEPYQEA